jgi:hypothetical protein
MLAVPELLVALPMAQPSAVAGESSSALPIVIVLALAIAVLVSIALDLRRLRRASRLRAVHSALGALFTVIVVGSTLALTAALGSAPSATAEQPDAIEALFEQAPEPERLDTSDITDPSTDIQLPTLAD